MQSSVYFFKTVIRINKKICLKKENSAPLEQFVLNTFSFQYSNYNQKLQQYEGRLTDSYQVTRTISLFPHPLQFHITTCLVTY